MASTELAQDLDTSTDCHFTYCTPKAQDLQQGDLLSKNTEIKVLLNRVYPHYLREDFTHFLILTQSCDLVRRHDGKCAARYITLAAVRPLSLLITREIRKYQRSTLTKAAMACSQRERSKLEMFLERFLNNNEPEYFYLHEEPALGFPESSCGFLRFSIPLRAYEHYETLLGARILSLTEIFQAKLGWLVGHMYSRVGTEDWVPANVTQQEFDDQISDLLDALCMWVEDERLQKAKREINEALLAEADIDALRDHIKKISIESKRDQVLNRVIQVLKEQELIVNGKTAKSIFNLLYSDPTIASLIKT